MRYNKSETRIINNAIKMADEVKKYHERTQSWDIPEHLIVDGCKVGKWWIEINKRIREGSIPDEVVHLMIDNKIDWWDPSSLSGGMVPDGKGMEGKT